MRAIQRRLMHSWVLPCVALVGILLGGGLWFFVPHVAHLVWFSILIVTGTFLVLQTTAGIWRGHWAADIIATVAIITAVILREPLAGLIIVLMQTGGEALERFAEGRASKAVRTLEADRPQVAHRIGRGGTLEDVRVDEVCVDDRLLVRPGELVPCDGIVVEGTSLLDVSRLTGEPLPQSVAPGASVSSGSGNGDRPLTLQVTKVAWESQYERIVALVRNAQATKAPFQRLADRYAVWFTPIVLIIAGTAWLLTQDSSRFLAVLVVATPCPLILAPPIAIIGGINRAARQHMIIRTGAAVEQLARVDTVVFDKTGTLTIGKPQVRDVIVSPPFTQETVLALAGAVEQHSSHLLARTLVDATVAARIELPRATDITEFPGRGVLGIVDGKVVAVGSQDFILAQLRDGFSPLSKVPDGLTACISVDGVLAGMVVYADRVRTNARTALSDLAALGIQRTILLSGDHPSNVLSVAKHVGISEATGNLHPSEKVDRVLELRRTSDGVMMVGDGTNDAPALAAAAVGVALAGHGGGVSAEAADVVILIDDVGRVPEVIRLSRRTIRIARQSIWIGLALSGGAMGFAAYGWLTPVVGALLQECIDIAVVLNALRAAGTDHIQGNPEVLNPDRAVSTTDVVGKKLTA